MAKAEQIEIPGTERPKIRVIENAAAKYEEKRDERMRATEAEVEAKDKLQKALHDNEAQLVDRDEDGNPGYVYKDAAGEPKIAILERSAENVKVKKWKAPPKDDATGAE